MRKAHVRKKAAKGGTKKDRQFDASLFPLLQVTNSLDEYLGKTSL